MVGADESTELWPYLLKPPHFTVKRLTSSGFKLALLDVGTFTTTIASIHELNHRLALSYHFCIK